MTASIVVLAAEQRPSGRRSVALLSEHDLDHYAAFARFFADTFDLDADPFGPPGLLLADGSRPYELVFVGRSGRPFPSGVEINALVEGLEPLDVTQADADLWAILHWLAAGLGHEWTIDALEATGRIYRIPAPQPPPGP